jgi:hypothetical protein
MATASASSGFWAAHVETERPLKGSKILRLGFLDGTRLCFQDLNFHRPCGDVQNIWGWELDGLRAMACSSFFPRVFRAPESPYF